MKKSVRYTLLVIVITAFGKLYIMILDLRTSILIC